MSQRIVSRYIATRPSENEAETVRMHHWGASRDEATCDYKNVDDYKQMNQWRVLRYGGDHYSKNSAHDEQMSQQRASRDE